MGIIENEGSGDAGSSSSSKKLSSKELSDIVNQQSPSSVKTLVDNKLKEKGKGIQLIDALAQPSRYAKNRGISASTISKMSDKKETVPAVPSTSKWLSKRKEIIPKIPYDPSPD